MGTPRLPIVAAAALVLSTTLWAAPSSGNRLDISAENIAFVHQPMESPSDLTCKHTPINPLSQDWEVLCADAAGKVRRKYHVHLWVTRYPRENEPRVSYELLYWVDDVTEAAKVVSTGNTTWFHLKEDSALHSLSVGQQVDNGQSGLYLSFKSP